MEQIIFSIFLLIICVHFTYSDKVCSSLDIKHERHLQKLRDCKVVLGHVRLSNFRLLDKTDIASSLEEITDYLIIYRVEGLETLENIFPNLTIIRGQELLFDKYSLVVYENRNIHNLGLKSLLKIRRGSIQIESNPVLCFADTVNWIYLIESHSQQYYSLKDNRDPNECPLCIKNVTNSETEYLKTNCWNLENFQRKKPIPHLKDCPHECGVNGCTSDSKCCSPLCLTGCFKENCQICKNFKNLQGNCVESCSVSHYMLADQCVTDRECLKKNLIPHAGYCLRECPRSYKKDIVNGIAQCNLLCNRNFTIGSKDDLEDVKDCVTIRGSLHIELKDDKSAIIEDLEMALGGIKEISGSLKITKSPQIVSLGFFKNLDTIKGDELIDREISLYVVDNFHLEEIWSANHKVAILKGRIFFHLNPRLCYDKILQLLPSIKSSDELRVRDASRNSNGERVVCGRGIQKLDAVTEDWNATAARIKVEPLHASDKELVLGYLHYYKEAPIKNVTLYDGRHGCGHDKWQVDMTMNRNVRHILSNLKPYTQYAFFVKTFTIVDHHFKKDWYSPILYFRTLAMKPGPVQRLSAIPISRRSLIVHWWPPKDVNGVIDKYLLRYELVQQHNNHSDIRGYESHKSDDLDCECGITTNNRGPPPDDLNYYNRNQATMEEALPNLIYVSSDTIRRIEEERRLEDLTRRKRETSKSSEGSPNNIETNDTAPKKNISAEEQGKIDDEKKHEHMFNQHVKDLEMKSRQEQDTGIGNYPIKKPTPICSVTNASKAYQKEQGCVNLEIYYGIEIHGKMHSYTLDNLEVDTFYKIFIRACVEGIQNGCGPERSIEAEAVSKSMEYLLTSP